jgi:hypothetical protein
LRASRKNAFLGDYKKSFFAPQINPVFAAFAKCLQTLSKTRVFDEKSGSKENRVNPTVGYRIGVRFC